MSILEKLTEGIIDRNLSQQGEALLNKWTQTGLLEGLQTENARQNMARLLENQAKELLRESNTMAGGDVQGFAAVAFPIVRRVFAGLIANDLVSVQPMSLPSGLVFFLDFTFGTAGLNPRLGETSGQSIYGQGVVGSQITGGVTLNSANIDKQPYAFASAYSSPTGSLSATFLNQLSIPALDLQGNALQVNISGTLKLGDGLTGSYGYQVRDLIKADPDLIDEHSGSYFTIRMFQPPTNFNYDDLSQLTLASGGVHTGMAAVTQVRRLTQLDPSDVSSTPRVYVVYVSGGTQPMMTNAVGTNGLV